MALAAQAWANDLGLTVVLPGGGGEVHLSMEDLKSLQQVRFRTRNDYVDGRPEFEGPPLTALLRHLGLEPTGKVRLVAANDYAVDAELEELVRNGAILAHTVDGRALSLRDKGPLWLMFPIDSRPELQRPEINRFLVWQLVRMDLS